MIYNKWEGEPVNVQARLEGDFSQVGTCTFVFRIDGQDEPVRDDQPIGAEGLVTSNWTPPAREDAAPEFYDVRVHIEVSGLGVAGEYVLRVWAKKRTVLAVDGSGKAVEGARIVVNDLPTQFRTDAQGKVEYQHDRFEPVVVTWDAPYQLYGWQQGSADQGRVRKAQLDKVEPCFILDPLPPDSGEALTWWVNLPPQQTAACGPNFMVTVVATPGYVVYARVTRGEHNVPLAMTKTGIMNMGGVKEWAEEGRVTRAQVPVDDGGHARFTVALGFSGGDEFLIEVGTTDAYADSKLKVVTWRRLWYQLTHPQGLQGLPDMKAIADTFKPGFVELVQEGATVVVPDLDGEFNWWIDGEWIGDQYKNQHWLNVGDRAIPNFHGKYFRDGARKPRMFHVALVGTNYGETDQDDNLLEESVTQEYDSLACERTTSWEGSGEQAVFIKHWVGVYAFPRRLDQVDPSVLAAGWQEVGGARRGDFSARDLWFHTSCRAQDGGWGYTYVRLRLSDDACAVLSGGGRIKVTTRVLGTQKANGTAMRHLTVNAVMGRDAAAIRRTICHELGHVMGQAFGGEDKPDLPRHPRAYNKKGHQGPHCATGMSKSDYRTLDSFRGKGAACTCIMYGESNGSSAFCSDCIRFMRGQDLRDVASSSLGFHGDIDPADQDPGPLVAPGPAVAPEAPLLSSVLQDAEDARLEAQWQAEAQRQPVRSASVDADDDDDDDLYSK